MTSLTRLVNGIALVDESLLRECPCLGEHFESLPHASPKRKAPDVLHNPNAVSFSFPRLLILGDYS
jgi:hypothetical protein